jgi:hypothetical protein
MLATTPARILATTGRETLAAFLASIPVAILGGTVLDRFGASPALVVAATLASWAAIIGVAYLASYVKAKPWTIPREPRPAEARLPVRVQAPGNAAKVAIAG